MKEIEGDLITLAEAGEFDIIAHGCNCRNTMGAGIAPRMERRFGALERDTLYHQCQEEISVCYSSWGLLGNIAWWRPSEDLDNSRKDCPRNLIVMNWYTQDNFGRNHAGGDYVPLDYEALTLCARKTNKEFPGMHIGLPLIGCGLAGGDWEKVKEIFKRELCDMQVTIVHYNKQQ